MSDVLPVHAARAKISKSLMAVEDKSSGALSGSVSKTRSQTSSFFSGGEKGPSASAGKQHGIPLDRKSAAPSVSAEISIQDA
jgi:hypothetical protein